jgi:8-oxo-dGTP pyrophosphatase MutT (NUDIX family)
VEPALTTFLCDLEPAARERVIWPSAAEFEITSYLTRREPPITLLTSVRAVVRRGDGVLVFDDERGECHILPGGRLERQESMLGALDRELAEETGCAITNEPRLIGVLHFHRLNALPSVLRVEPGFPSGGLCGDHRQRSDRAGERSVGAPSTVRAGA